MTQAPAVLVVEDEADLQEAMVSFLNLEGFAADGVGSVEAAEAWLRTHRVSVVVLDLGLPGEDGLAWLQRGGLVADKAVVIVSAWGELDDRLRGLGAGAEGYLVKPVALPELAALVRNLAARVQAPPAGWTLNTVTWTMRAPDGSSMKLTAAELAVLRRLADNAGEAVPRASLAEALGRQPHDDDPRRLEVLVRRLRNKAARDLGQALPLATVRAYGYAFTARIGRDEEAD